MKKRFLVVIFLCVFVFTHLTATAFADSHPLAVSDRITSELAALQSRKDDIAATRTAMHSASVAQVAYGQSTGRTDDFSFYLNRKILTKKELEAFKWSFIFSQFARPLQNGLLDVFSQDFFDEMISQDFDIESLKSTLVNGLFNPQTDNSLDANAADMNDDLAVMMLDSVNFNDLVDVIEQNYAVYALHDINGSEIKFSTVLNGARSIYEPFYIYDISISDSTVGKDNINMLNGIYYNQSLIGNNSFSSRLPTVDDITEIEVPVAFYDSSFFMYAQLALSAFFKSNSEYKTIDDVINYLGDSSLAVDTYGNICVLTPGPKAVILVPNFGNSALMNTLLKPEDISAYDESNQPSTKNTANIDSDAVLDSRINMFNAWVTSQYSRVTRSKTTIYPQQYTVSLYNSASHFSHYLKQVQGSLSNTFVLVENSMLDMGNKHTEDIINYYNSRLKNVEIFDGNTLKNLAYSLGANASIYYSHAAKYFLWLHWNTTSGDVLATLMSPYNSNFHTNTSAMRTLIKNQRVISADSQDSYDAYGTFAPFIAYPEADIDTYENKYPLIQNNISPVASSSSNSKGALTETIYASVGNSLAGGKWYFCKGSHANNGTIYYVNKMFYSSATKTGENNASSLSTYNDCVSFMCNLPEDQLIKDERFIHHLGANKDGTDCSFMYLPKESIDLGQSMSAYKQSLEKGMFLTDYQVMYSAGVSDYLNHISLAARSFAEYDKASKSLSKIFPNHIGSNDASNVSFDFSDKDSARDNTTLDSTNKFNNSDILRSNFISSSFWESVYDWTKDSWKSINVAYIVEKIFTNERQKPKYSIGYISASDFPQDVILDETEDFSESIVDYVYYCTEYNNEPSMTADNTISDLTCNPEPKDGELLKALMKAIENQATELSGINDISQFESQLLTMCNSFDFDFNKVYNNLINCGRQSGWDGNGDGKANNYFFDEYVYSLRNISSLSETIGCNNKNDFVTTTYFWDRYYLVNSAFNTSIANYVRDGFYGQLENQISDYQQYLEKTFQTSLQYPFNKYVEDNPNKFKASNSVPSGETCYLPYTIEYALQPTSFNEWKTANPTRNVMGSNSTSLVGGKGSTDYLAFYDYLDMDTIILHPFGWDNYDKQIYLYSGLGTNLPQLAVSMRADIKSVEESRTSQVINPIKLIMSLQKNANSAKNALNYTYTRSEVKSTVTEEELMESAGEFFRHPVTTLSYIITGFLYKVHAAVALGDLGSVFSINFLLESDIYQWIIHRYAALVSIAIAVVLFFKLIQFAMNHSADFTGLGKTCLGIISMCLVPLVIFNSSIWIFDNSSHWALKGSADKILLSQIDSFTRYDGNDGNVAAEQAIFQEQFNALKGTYSGLQVQQMTGYSPAVGANYTVVPVLDYINNVKYNIGMKEWYGSSDGQNDNFSFKSVHSSLYDQSYFYFFYDYIKSEYYDYCSTHASNSGTQAVSNTISKLVITGINSNPDPSSSSSVDAAANNINETENSFRTLTGNFRQMLLDTNYVYGNSIIESNTDRYGGPQAKDLVGLYMIFDNSEYPLGSADENLQTLLQSTVNYRAFLGSKVMTVHKDSLDPCVWTDNAQVAKYVEERTAQHKGYRSGIDSGNAIFPVFTSKLDAYNSVLNPLADQIDAHQVYSSPILTPLEETLCKVTEDIYDTTLQALNYLPGQIHDEAAITLMAFIANFKLNEAFGYEPVSPLEESIYLDNVIRTAFVTDLSEISSSTNALYAMVAQGDSIGKVALVVILEIIITVASVARVLIILYITIASFIILMLRLLHKAPETNELVYGIVGNILALLILHVITLFLVVVAVEWVANATSAIPGIILDILIVAFIIIVSVALFKLCKNLIRDAAHLSGVKFKELIHKIGDSVMNISGKIVSSFSSGTAQADNITINAMSAALNRLPTNGESRSETERDLRALAILRKIAEVEASEENTKSRTLNSTDLRVAQISERIDSLEHNTHI